PKLKLAQPKWQSEAHRVVALQQRSQAVSMAFLQPVFFAGAAYVLRALQPSEDRINVNAPHRPASELAQLAAALGQLVAWGQLRSAGREGSAIADQLIDFGQRKKWKAELLATSLDCAVQIHQDAACFNAAYDDGAFGA
ncbi:DUF2252 family protein, partial [Roseateles sp. GG27B]